MEVLGGISAVIAIIDALIEVWNGVQKDHKLSTTFVTVANRLPILRDTLQTCHEHFRPVSATVASDVAQRLTKTVGSCKSKAEDLKIIFTATVLGEDDQWFERYRKAVRRLGKGERVEDLMKAMTEDAKSLANYHGVISASPGLYAKLEEIVQEMDALQPSLPSEADGAASFNSGDEEQYVHTVLGMIEANKSSGYMGEYSGDGNPVFGFGKN